MERIDYLKKTKEFLNEAYQGNIDNAKKYLSETIVLEMGGDNKLSGKHSGRDAFFDNFSLMMELSGGTYKMSKQYDWLNGISKAVLIAQESVEKNGKKIFFDRVVQYDFENGEINRIKLYEADPVIVNQVFS